LIPGGPRASVLPRAGYLTSETVSVGVFVNGVQNAEAQLAAAAGVSLSELSAVLLGKCSPSPSTLTKLCMAVSRLQRAESEEAEQTTSVLEEVRRHCKRSGLRPLARRAGMDPANLNGVLKGRRKPSQGMLMKLKKALHGY
jgi:transcriptional regulator with XRE-family HTH domain